MIFEIYEIVIVCGLLRILHMVYFKKRLFICLIYEVKCELDEGFPC